MEPEANTTEVIMEPVAGTEADIPACDPAVATPTTEGHSQSKTLKKARSKSLQTPNRAAADCYTTDPTKMTEKEKIDVILFYQKNMESLYQQFESYKKNTESAFEQVRILRNDNEKIRNESRAKINLLKQNINMMYQNSLLVEMEG